MFELWRGRNNEGTAALLVGADLRCRTANREWRRLTLPGGDCRAHERIDRLFPQSEVAACVLDVLASGKALENVVAGIGDSGCERFLRMNFYPLPEGQKARTVRIEACEMSAQLVLDGDTGEVLGANRAAAEVFGDGAGADRFLRRVDSLEKALASAADTGSYYLGRFKYRRPDGREIEVESMLAVVGA